jgi:3-dehydrotetronate 4-kinase
MAQLLLGAIADDFTGATDLANMLVRGGMRTIQTIGIPSAALAEEVDAVVVALKSRTIPAQQAVEQSLAALAWLQAAGCRQVYFKYCSTFDSTPRGNIGPVIDALMDALQTDFTISCPAFPENGRTICHGYLFVGEQLLSESGMKDHPLTPMTDANLARVLAPQTQRKVGNVGYAAVAAGAAAVRAATHRLKADGIGIAIVDALADADLRTIAEAYADLPLVTAGSGVGLGMAEHCRKAGLLSHSASAAPLPRVRGAGVILSGSCSTATNEQVVHWTRQRSAFRLDPLRLAEDPSHADAAIAWARRQDGSVPILIYATASAPDVKHVQQQLGAARAGQLVEQAFARIAKGLVEAGVRKLIVAGGETAGAVVSALGVRSLRIGPQIDPGVPWTESLDGEPIALALKSGNFGSADFFEKALAQLE